VFAQSATELADALVNQASLSGSSSLALADLNRDGNLDAVAVAGSSGVKMHLGGSLALASSQVTSSAAVSVAAGMFDSNPVGDLAIVLSTGSTVVASDINSSTGAPVSTSTTDCYGTGVHVAVVATYAFGSNGACNSNELAVTRTATSQVCTMSFKCQANVVAIPSSGCATSNDPNAGYAAGSNPTAGWTGLPTLGNNSFELTLQTATNYVYAATLAQISSTPVTPGATINVSLLDNGCYHVFTGSSNYTDVIQISTITDSQGRAVNRMPIPATTSLSSMELKVQWLLIDGGPMFSRTMGLSDGLLVRIGDYSSRN